MANDFEILTASCVDEVGAEAWDTLSAGRPFQSARWYRFGELVMEGCQPLYIILSVDQCPVARATFWLVRDEPLVGSRYIRGLLHPVMQRWPLLICRSPLSNSSGLILPEPPLQAQAIRLIAETAFKAIQRLHASFLIFDYLEHIQTNWPDWPDRLRSVMVADPGTRMELQAEGFSGYLKSNAKSRIHQHFKRTCRSAQDLGIQVTRHASFDDSLEALDLIRQVEQRHASMPNPWAGGMLKHMQSVESTWLTAHIGDRLVGCLLLLVDNGVQIACLPGLTDDVPFAYFMLLYEAIQDAFDRKLVSLRWGSGAYETKRRLGFDLEHNNNIMFQGNGLICGLIGRLASSVS